METWMMTSFGGDRLVQVPVAYHGNLTGIAASLSHLGQDPTTKQ
jgi:hypothetical protein